MLQIFVRPHGLGLDPTIQHEPIPDPVPNQWRHLVAPSDGDTTLSVRNDVGFYDCRLGKGKSVTLPSRAGWDTYCYVFAGAVEVGEESVGVSATESATIIGFCINHDAPVPRQGTIAR